MLAALLCISMMCSRAACGSVDEKAEETSGETKTETTDKKGDGGYTIAVVPKMTSIVWFQRIRKRKRCR